RQNLNQMGLRTQISAFIKPDSWEIDKYFQGPGRCQKAHFHPFFEREKALLGGPSNRQLVPDTFRKRNPESDAMGERASRRTEVEAALTRGSSSLFGGRTLGMRTKEQSDHAIHDQTDPKIDEQAQVGP